MLNKHIYQKKKLKIENKTYALLITAQYLTITQDKCVQMESK